MHTFILSAVAFGVAVPAFAGKTRRLRWHSPDHALDLAAQPFIVQVSGSTAPSVTLLIRASD